jgi:hypothetical protein
VHWAKPWMKTLLLIWKWDLVIGLTILGMMGLLILGSAALYGVIVGTIKLGRRLRGN